MLVGTEWLLFRSRAEEDKQVRGTPQAPPAEESTYETARKALACLHLCFPFYFSRVCFRNLRANVLLWPAVSSDRPTNDLNRLGRFQRGRHTRPRGGKPRREYRLRVFRQS